MEVISVQDMGETSIGTRRYLAEVKWNLDLSKFYFLAKLPILGRLFQFNQSTKRQIEMVFEPYQASDVRDLLAGSIEEDSRSLPSSASSSPRSRDLVEFKHSPCPDVFLTRVIYSQNASILPGALKGIPFVRALCVYFSKVFHLFWFTFLYLFRTRILPYLFDLSLPFIYGILLLFGLDHSTRSLSSSSLGYRRRQRRERKKAAKQPVRHSKSSFALSSDSDEGSEAPLPVNASESTYHRRMRAGNEKMRFLQKTWGDSWDFVSEASKEFIIFTGAMGSAVKVVVQFALGLGLHVLGASNGAKQMSFEEEKSMDERAATMFGRSFTTGRYVAELRSVRSKCLTSGCQPQTGVLRNFYRQAWRARPYGPSNAPS